MRGQSIPLPAFASILVRLFEIAISTLSHSWVIPVGAHDLTISLQAANGTIAFKTIGLDPLKILHGSVLCYWMVASATDLRAGVGALEPLCPICVPTGNSPGKYSRIERPVQAHTK